MTRSRILPMTSLLLSALGLSIAFQNCAPASEESSSSRSPASDFRGQSSSSSSGVNGLSAVATGGSDPSLSPSNDNCVRPGQRAPSAQVKPSCPSGSVIYRKASFRQGDVENHLIRVFQGSELSGSAYSSSGSVSIEIGEGETDVHLILMAYQPVRWTINGRLDRIKSVELDGFYCQQVDGIDAKKVSKTYHYQQSSDDLNFTSQSNRFDGGFRSVERIYGLTLTSGAYAYDARCADNIFHIR